jgi:(p)ppGpp synthase/HD superfamily hydrolase
MGNKMTLADCVRLAEFAHFHQTDKAGANYIDHPKRVLASVQAQGAPPYVQMAAVLHDVTEDTPFTPEMLLARGVPDAAVEIVKLLDRGISAHIYENMGDDALHFVFGEDSVRVNMTPDEYYYFAIRRNRDAVTVKLADIGDNLQPWRLVYLPAKQQEKLQIKYTKAVRLLTE